MSKIRFLRDRADMFRKVREYFFQKNVLEVDCPILSGAASIDSHIDLIPAFYSAAEKRYLHSSPEYGMKRLLAENSGDIFQLSHVFRDGELGFKHNPEFTMVEWYRVGIPYLEMVKETIEFIRLFLGNLPFEILSYREMFLKYAGIDYVFISEEELKKKILLFGKEVYPSLFSEGKDAMLNWLLGIIIEPQLGKEQLFVLNYYPHTQAALAKTKVFADEVVAERFEIYYKGLELANGYHELTNANEQRKRFEESNHHRISLGKEAYPIDENFLKALEKGIPDCCGVAVGFDRLMMLRHQTTNINNVIPFGWAEA